MNLGEKGVDFGRVSKVSRVQSLLGSVSTQMFVAGMLITGGRVRKGGSWVKRRLGREQ